MEATAVRVARYLCGANVAGQQRGPVVPTPGLGHGDNPPAIRPWLFLATSTPMPLFLTRWKGNADLRKDQRPVDREGPTACFRCDLQTEGGG